MSVMPLLPVGRRPRGRLALFPFHCWRRVPAQVFSVRFMRFNAGLGGPGPSCYSRFTVGGEFWSRLSVTFINFMLTSGPWAGVGLSSLSRFTGCRCSDHAENYG